MEIQQLKGFLAVAKYKGFSRAAEKTYRTQPAISLQVRSLEDELGIKLFDRLGPGKVVLTDEGKVLFELASPLLDDIETLAARFNEARGGVQKGAVRVATHTSVMVYLLPDIIRQFKKKYPKCDLSIVNRGRKDILTMLNSGDIDVGIASLKNIPQYIEYRAFASFDRVLITPKGHPLSKKAIIKPKDIAAYPLILSPVGSNTRAVIDLAFEEKGLKYKAAIEITGRAAVKTYVEMGLGVSIINGFYVSKEDKNRLFVKNMSNYFGKAERGILTRKNKYLSKPAKEFIGMILQKYGLA